MRQEPSSLAITRIVKLIPIATLAAGAIHVLMNNRTFLW